MNDIPQFPGATIVEHALETEVVIAGVKKRIATLETLNARFAILQAPGAQSIYVSRDDFLPIQDNDLKRRLACEVVIIGYKDGHPIFGPAFMFWTGHVGRHVYRQIAFTNQPLPAETYNLYRGLGATPKRGNCDLIRVHISDVICTGDKVSADAMIKLLAWQI